MKPEWAARIVMTIGALIGIAGIGLQFYYVLQIPGISTAEAVVRFFSYFTILTNLLVLFVYLFPLMAPESWTGRFFAGASIRGGAAVYIVIVGVVYNVLLRQLYHPVGWAKVADDLVHMVAPIFYAFFWLAFAGKAGLRWRDATAWLAYPLIYLVYTLLRGAVVGYYPYPFVDVGVLGYSRVLMNAVGFTVVFWMLGLVVISIGKWMASGRVSASAAASESADL